MENESLFAIIQVVTGLVGVIVGGFITYFVERSLQNRQFRKEKNEKKEILKCYLEILKNEIEDEHKRLWNLRNSISGGYPREYFDPTVKRTILQEIIKLPLFTTHSNVFTRINSLIQRYENINNQIKLVQDYIQGKFVSVEDKDYKIRQEYDNLYNLVNDAISTDIKESNNKPDLASKLGEIQKLL